MLLTPCCLAAALPSIYPFGVPGLIHRHQVDKAAKWYDASRGCTCNGVGCLPPLTVSLDSLAFANMRIHPRHLRAQFLAGETLIADLYSFDLLALRNASGLSGYAPRKHTHRN